MFGLITGSGLYDLPSLTDRSSSEISTPFGPATVTTGSWHGQSVAFLARHGSAHSVPPSGINYRANIWALREVGVRTILATAVSGGISTEMTPGRLVLISDYLNFTTGRADTFFDGSTEPFSAAAHHTDMTDPYSSRFRAVVRNAAAAEQIELIDGGVYCATNGPRFETPAEITMMRRLGGDLVGMTGYPEVALAVEAGLEYCSIGLISNPAAGLGEPLDVEDIFALIDEATEPLQRLITRTILSSRAA